MYKKQPHKWTPDRPRRICGYSVCRGCGLVALNNPLTRKANLLGCNFEEHPKWKTWVAKLTAV